MNANTFKITFNGQTKEYDHKVKILDLIEGDRHQYINASVNNRLRELNYEVFYDCEIEFFTKKDYLAIKTYETSLRYIIAMACSIAFPEHRIKFSYNISRSIFISFLGDVKSFTSDDLDLLDKTIKDIISKDYPLVRKIYSNEEVKTTFELFLASFVKAVDETHYQSEENDKLVAMWNVKLKKYIMEQLNPRKQ